MHKRGLSFFLLIAVWFISCDRNQVYDENMIIENGTWNLHNPVVFEATISEPYLRYNVYLNVRNANVYPFSNLFLFLTTTFPDDRQSKDTLELTLADYDGRWLGSGMGSVKFNRFLLKKNVQFTQKGRYRFKIEQAMRVNDLKGIHDVGLRIEKQ